MNQMTIIADKINSSLERFERIFLVLDSGDDEEDLAYDFCSSKALKETTKKILILSDKDIPYRKNLNCQIQRLNGKEIDMIRQIYFMYDFSDRFEVLSNNPQYGGLLNYVKTGDMTMEAVFQTILES